MKEKLNLSVEKSVKKRAKKIADVYGKSISTLFEQFIINYKVPDEWQPPANSGTEELVKAIPNEKKKKSYDFKKLKKQAIQNKYNK